MIKILSKKANNLFTIEGIFQEDKNQFKNDIILVDYHITEFISQQKIFIFLGKKNQFNITKLKNALDKIINLNTRDLLVKIASFQTKNINEAQVLENLVLREGFLRAKLYNLKSKKPAKPKEIYLEKLSNKQLKQIYDKASVYAHAINYARNLQFMPPNVLNSITYAQKIKKDFATLKNVNLKIFTKKEIEKLKMNLFLSVNSGSAYEPRMVFLEYKGNPSSKSKIAFVGKGITFDAGGYNVKVGYSLQDMKFDMSGSAIIAGAFYAIAKLKPKVNVSALLMLTDNMINANAFTPDAVFKAMNGKTVEINNTDAEGRLVLADGLTYAAKNLKATRIVDVATLTGAMISALGHTYTGIWTTTEKAWKDVKKAADSANELVWRMPLHEDFIKYMKGSKIADLKNTALDRKGGSSTAAMFLTNFVEDVEYIHMDVAGTSDIDGMPMGAMVKTLVKLVL